MVTLSLTGFYASLLGLLYIGLSVNIIRLRLSAEIGIGTSGNDVLAKRVRVHGNFAEYVPLALILLGCYEINGASAMMLHILGGVLLLARLSHAIGLNKTIGSSTPRLMGVLSTFAVLLVLSIENIRLFVFA
ncbi:MAPEG family protein [Colwellia sp. C1TZA3]|uniref:MAPEG family protein n=1 Tax=Colwellia sp. C1TZA3 TaxID=2508879 RepID=UPI0011B95E33|nr:MAPEG family protein [Colwellia sp. C1TZA3]TWX63777.1 glutathione S-transferase [Colwellia sp. C1TZA3]